MPARSRAPADAGARPARSSAESRAQALIDGPRKGVYGPFVPLFRSPAPLERMAKVGEYLRFDSMLEPRLRELATCVAARHVSTSSNGRCTHPWR